MRDLLDVVLLLALPASGKSEVRRYLASLPPEVARRDFGLGATVQLDDFPYVHLMRCIDDALLSRARPAVFFEAPDRSFRDPRDWGTLIELINQDYRGLLSIADAPTSPASSGSSGTRQASPLEVRGMFDRIDRAGQSVGIEPRLRAQSERTIEELEVALAEDVARLHGDAVQRPSDSAQDRTLVIEFARGGAFSSGLPLPTPFGYRYSLSLLDPEILRRASILYVWVTPEISRAKNRERSDPNDPGSVLHHGVPEHVMRHDYGLDDMGWLIANASVEGTIRVTTQAGDTFDVPVGRFDNCADKTTFVRSPTESWSKEQVRGLHGALNAAFEEIARGRQACAAQARTAPK